MAKALQRTPLAAPAFIRLIARLGDAGLSTSGVPLADRLSGWIDWTRAVALSKALDGRLPPPAGDATVSGTGEAQEYARVRAALVDAIALDVDPGARKQNAATLRADEGTDTTIAFLPFRERYRDLQQAMQAAAGKLRGRLRDQLGSASPDLARLAEVDAIMEMTLTPREHALLASVPTLLGRYFERLSAQAQASRDAETLAPSADTRGASPDWSEQFQQDMRELLLAELDLRFQPVEGLLSALRPR